jgi:hypothetical protein
MKLIYILLFCLPLGGFAQGFLLNPYAFSSAVYEPEYQRLLDTATARGYDHPSVGVGADEPLRRWAVELDTRSAQHIRRGSDLVSEHVAQRHHPYRWIGFNSLQSRPGATAAAAHEANPQSLFACGET